MHRGLVIKFHGLEIEKKTDKVSPSRCHIPIVTVM